VLVAAAIVPGTTFALGAQTVLFNAAGYAGDDRAIYYDVAPDGKRFVFLRPVAAAGRAGTTVANRLVEVTNWSTEVQAKLAVRAPQ